MKFVVVVFSQPKKLIYPPGKLAISIPITKITFEVDDVPPFFLSGGSHVWDGSLCQGSSHEDDWFIGRAHVDVTTVGEA